MRQLGEIEFLFEQDGEVVIVECKSSNNKATSMKYVIANPKKFGVHPAIKFADTNTGAGDGFKTYPLYAVGFMKKKPNYGTVKEVDVHSLKVPTGKMS